MIPQVLAKVTLYTGIIFYMHPAYERVGIYKRNSHDDGDFSKDRLGRFEQFILDIVKYADQLVPKT